MDIKTDVVLGIHSIIEALNNPLRRHVKLICSEKGFLDLKRNKKFDIKKIDKSLIEHVTSHQLQELGKRYFKELGFEYQRIPSQVFLVTSRVKLFDISSVYEEIKSRKNLKIFCLDRVTDIHNGAAILRTAAFYGVDYLLISMKGNFTISPSFSRISSGALEHVKIVKCSNLSKVLQNLQKFEVQCIGFSESAKGALPPSSLINNVCLVVGAEDVGLSNAVLRALKYHVSFIPRGKISSLNVSVAAAIAMEKFFAT